MAHEFYSDAFTIRVNPYGVAIGLGCRGLQDQGMPPPPVAIVHTSLQGAKVLAMILRKVLKEMERKSDYKIELLPAVHQELGLAPEDW